MDPTTLVAFLFKAPAEARTVELLGSWDNFSQPYPMHHDRRRGTGFWSGCFKFHDIIFDGDSSYWTKPRTGGLKQGGTYWYYYRLNDQVEAYDDSLDHTSSCPLLPGQPVNVMEVPTEVFDLPPRCRSASLGVAGTIASLPNTHTLDPKDKFAALEPPPVSKVHGRCVSDPALCATLESKAQSIRSIESPPSSSWSEQEQPSWPLSSPPERYYAGAHHAYESYNDGRSSLYSRRSWRSAAPSFAHSSIVDAYGAESNAFEVDSFDLYSVRENASQASDPQARPTYEDDEFFDFNGDAETRDDDYGLEPADYPLPASRSTFNSLNEFNFFESRPTTSYSRPQSESQLFSTPQELHSNVTESPSYWDSQSEAAPRQSDEQSSEARQDSFDMLSPTFSAATVSSAGMNTPFRLSIGCARTNSAYEHDDTSIESVAERLRSLGSDEHYDIHPIYESEEPEAFTGYALPLSEAARSTQSLGKLSSAHESIVHDLPLPSTVLETREASFSDAIFSELGFLGGSIA